MEPAKKRIKLEDTSLEVIGNILSFVRKPDLKNVYLVCKEIYSELSRLNKTKVMKIKFSYDPESLNSTF